MDAVAFGRPRHWGELPVRAILSCSDTYGDFFVREFMYGCVNLYMLLYLSCALLHLAIHVL